MKFFPVLLLAINAFTLNSAYAFETTQQTEMITAHNKYRSEVGTPPLTWSAKLASTAQIYADTLKAAKGCKPIHSRSTELGENLYWASAISYSNGTSKPQVITPTQVTDSWGSEKADYNYGTNTCTNGKICGHYTQIIWKTTAQVGCGKAVCSDNSQVWVCNYSPAGNFIGETPY